MYSNNVLNEITITVIDILSQYKIMFSTYVNSFDQNSCFKSFKYMIFKYVAYQVFIKLIYLREKMAKYMWLWHCLHLEIFIIILFRPNNTTQKTL